jgi:NADPH:quinone reductase-like Zn-dependent oxidoreductase
MKAIVLNEYGAATNLKAETVADPETRAGELKVKVAAASLNPFDWKVRAGIYKDMFPMKFPLVLGNDVAGVVAEVGSGVTGFKVGDKVLGMVQRGYAEQVTAPASHFALVPEGLDLKDAAGIPAAGLTGVQLAEEVVDVKSGQTVLVTGAVGTVGRFAVYAAKLRGAKVIAGVRKLQLAEAQNLGADSVVAIDDDAAIAALPMLDAIADTVGGQTLAKLTPKVKNGGVVGSTVGPPPGDAARQVTGKGMQSRPDGKRIVGLAAAVKGGQVQLPIAKRFPLDQAAQAHAFAEKGGVVGKVLLTV